MYRKALRKRHAEEVGLFTGVEAAVAEEIGALGDHNRPGLEAAAMALARLMDNPRAVSTQPAAAKVLGALLEKLRSASARGRRGNLAVVRAMASRDLGTR